MRVLAILLLSPLLLSPLLFVSLRAEEERPRLFRPVSRPTLPPVADTTQISNPIDVFIQAKLESMGLSAVSPADKRTLLRRVTLDLTGLPPTLAEQEAFLADASPDAYAKLVDRLLASPRFGERQAQFWLDLVRYAETDGFNQDAHRPDGHKYRDWVIRAFNDNLSYAQFTHWQLAGDELAPENPDALIAAGYHRLHTDEYNAANLEQRRQEILDDNTDTTGLAFLGLTFGCARCHDHKYDPISHKDYFRLQSFMVGIYRRDVPELSPEAQKRHEEALKKQQAATTEIREQMEKLISKKRQELRQQRLERFHKDIQAAVLTPEAKRTPYQKQIAQLALKQIDEGGASALSKLSPEAKKRYLALEKELHAKGGEVPRLPMVMTVSDVGTELPPTHRLMGGDWRKPASEVKPTFPEALGGGEPNLKANSQPHTSGRRSALAKWLTSPSNPLFARVMVNRLWQHHFGVGIVATSSDFGVQGTPPTHPELLDWLAVEFIDSGFDLKRLHRLMVMSAAYRRDSRVDQENVAHQKALSVDRENSSLWRANRRRLEGEAVRDGILHLSGELNLRMFGPSAKPELPAAFSKAAWKPDDREQDRNRRSIYVLAKRNLRYPLFDAFDQPDLHNSCSRRMTTTTAPQALILLNSELTLKRAARWANSLDVDHPELIETTFQAAFTRRPTSEEADLSRQFLARQTKLQGGDLRKGLVDYCHALLNTNEFLYID